MAMKKASWVLVILGFCGCRDADEAVCSASVSLSGYFTASLPEQVTCSGLIGGIDMHFAPETTEDSPLSGFEVIVPDAGRGETGVFAARVLIFGAPQGLWETDTCSVTIETNDNHGQVCYEKGFHQQDCEDVDSYRVRGHGECREQARTPDGALLTVGPFEFATDVWWPR